MAPGPKPRGMKPAVENPGKIFKRLMSYVFSKYKIQLIIVALCIVASVICNARGTMFMQQLIDEYITPLLVSGSKDLSGLAKAITKIGVFYVIGIICVFVQNMIMVYVTQGLLKSLRDDLLFRLYIMHT